MNDESETVVTYDDAKDVIRSIANDHKRATGRSIRCIVAFGGTALAAHGIRSRSTDLDVYMTDVDDTVIRRAVEQHRAKLGPKFKIDATQANTLYGIIALADIEKSPLVGYIETDGGPLALRAVGIETMYVLKVFAGRAKD